MIGTNLTIACLKGGVLAELSEAAASYPSELGVIREKSVATSGRVVRPRPKLRMDRIAELDSYPTYLAGHFGFAIDTRISQINLARPASGLIRAPLWRRLRYAFMGGVLPLQARFEIPCGPGC